MKSFFVVVILFMFVQCSLPPEGRLRGGVGDIVDAVQTGGERLVSICAGDECCKEHKECVRTCNHLFSRSDREVRNKCKALPKDAVTGLDELIDVFVSPVLDDLDRLDLTEEFRLLMALDYHALVKIIQTYDVDDARLLLIWFAENDEPVQELLRLSMSAQKEIVAEMLTGAGDRNRPGPIEEGLSRLISFDRSFFQLLIANANYDLLQVTHEMIKEDLCSAAQYGGHSQTELCILRIYCKEKENRNNEYVHPEDVRNEMARNIDDEELFSYIERDILRTGLGVGLHKPRMNNDVCFAACSDSSRGCE